MNNKKRSLLAFALFLVGGVSMAQSKLSPSTRHFLMNRMETRATGEESVSAYLHLKDRGQGVSQLEALGVKVILDLGDILTVRIPFNRIVDVEALDFVRYIQVGTPVRQMLDKARPAAGADLIHAGEGLNAGPYTGKGVVVGVVDNGFDYTHPAFYDENRENLRISRVWELATSTGTPPAGFDYGTEFSDSVSIIESRTDMKTNSHGTHVAAIAAGNNRSAGNPYYGLAYDAELVFVSRGEITESHVDISNAVAYIFDYAKSQNKPCVVNLSLGTMIGPHDGTSSFDQVTDRLQGEGMLLVGSSGNHGADYTHASTSFSGEEGEGPAQIMTEFKIKPSTTNIGGVIDVWGEVGMEFDLRVLVVKESTGEIVQASEAFNVSLPEGGSYQTEVSNSSKGMLYVTTEINPFNGKPHALIESQITSLRMNYALALEITPRSAGTVHMWADDVYLHFLSEVPAGWIPGDNLYSNAEIGGTGKQIISVGAYCTRDKYPVYGTSREDATGHTLDSLADFSGVGPTLDGRMKPDVIAPGTFIASAINSNDLYYSSYPQASEVIWNGTSYKYAFMQGTSMSSPFMAGTVALWLQANPNLTPDDVRTILKKTAIHNPDYPASSCGYGKLDAYAGLKEVLTLAASVADAPMETSGRVIVPNLQGDVCRLLFTSDTPETCCYLTTLSGAIVRSVRFGRKLAGEEVSISLSGLDSGLYILRVNGTSYKLVLP